jgi:cell division protein FtsB
MRWLAVILVVLLLGLQYRLWLGEGSLAQKTALERQVEEQGARIDVLAERNRILAEEVNGLKSGLDAIEERARTDLGMVKQDETFFLVVDSRVPERRDPPPLSLVEDDNVEDVVDSIPPPDLEPASAVPVPTP